MTGIANPLGEIDEGHQARDCITWLSSTSFRVERVDHACSSNAFRACCRPAESGARARPPASRGSARRGRRGRQTKPRTVKRSSHSLTYASGTRQRRRSRASGTACATSRTSFVTSPTHAKAAGGPALRSTTLGRTSAAPTRSSLRGSQMLGRLFGAIGTTRWPSGSRNSAAFPQPSGSARAASQTGWELSPSVCGQKAR